jgi:hypothetical protein
MSSWSREKDAWLARECEGWTLIESGELAGMWKKPDLTVHHCPYYLTDPAAAIRAAEAWRKKACKFRIVRLSLHSRGCSARLYDGLNCINEGPHTDSAAALSQALYRATGGPA